MAGKETLFQLYSLQGEKFFESGPANRSILGIFGIVDLPSGVYTCVLKNGGKRLCKQVVYSK
jgi:hypothetical protein